MLVAHFESRFRAEIFKKVFLPYIVYFLVAVYYHSTYTTFGIHSKSDAEVKQVYVLSVVFVGLALYFLYIDMLRLYRDRWAAFTSNYYFLLDLCSYGVNIFAAIATVSKYKIDPDDPGNKKLMIWLSVAGVTLMWRKAFSWMRLNSEISVFVRLLRETIKDLGYFILVFVYLLFAFANMVLIMNQGRPVKIFSEFFSYPYIDAVMNQYLLSLGEFESLDSFEKQGKDVVIWLIFIATTFMIQIIGLNMLIAQMSDTFDRITELKNQSATKEKIDLFSEYSMVVKRQSMKDDTMSRFLFAITPKNIGIDELSNWEGTVAEIKRYIDQNDESMKGTLGKRMGNIADEVTLLTRRHEQLDEKLNDLQGNQQRNGIQLNKLDMQFTKLNDNISLLLERGGLLQEEKESSFPPIKAQDLIPLKSPFQEKNNVFGRQKLSLSVPSPKQSP